MEKSRQRDHAVSLLIDEQSSGKSRTWKESPKGLLWHKLLSLS